MAFDGYICECGHEYDVQGHCNHCDRDEPFVHVAKEFSWRETIIGFLKFALWVIVISVVFWIAYYAGSSFSTQCIIPGVFAIFFAALIFLD